MKIFAYFFHNKTIILLLQFDVGISEWHLNSRLKILNNRSFLSLNFKNDKLGWYYFPFGGIVLRWIIFSCIVVIVVVYQCTIINVMVSQGGNWSSLLHGGSRCCVKFWKHSRCFMDPIQILPHPSLHVAGSKYIGIKIQKEKTISLKKGLIIILQDFV